MFKILFPFIVFLVVAVDSFAANKSAVETIACRYVVPDGEYSVEFLSKKRGDKYVPETTLIVTNESATKKLLLPSPADPVYGLIGISVWRVLPSGELFSTVNPPPPPPPAPKPNLGPPPVSLSATENALPAKVLVKRPERKAEVLAPKAQRTSTVKWSIFVPGEKIAGSNTADRFDVSFNRRLQIVRDFDDIEGNNKLRTADNDAERAAGCTKLKGVLVDWSSSSN